MTQDPEKADGPAAPGRRSHHISSIAHLFFAEDEAGTGSAGSGGGLRLAVACFNQTRIAAFTAGGLVAQSRPEAGAGRAVRLIEEAGLRWSACSFLSRSSQPGRPEVRPAPGAWTWPEGVARSELGALVCWTHLMAGRERGMPDCPSAAASSRPPDAQAVLAWSSPARHGLIACLLAREVGDLTVGVRLGRLLGQLSPERLEVLVFPDKWDQGRGLGRRGRRWFDRLGGQEAELLTRCQDLTRALGGACPVTITTLPDDDTPEASDLTAGIIQKLAGRLTADFWVDPAS